MMDTQELFVTFVNFKAKSRADMDKARVHVSSCSPPFPAYILNVWPHLNMHFGPWNMMSLGLRIGELGGDHGETPTPESRASLLPNFSQVAWKAKNY